MLAAPLLSTFYRRQNESIERQDKLAIEHMATYDSASITCNMFIKFKWSDSRDQYLSNGWIDIILIFGYKLDTLPCNKLLRYYND
jgi:hypothetical protein